MCPLTHGSETPEVTTMSASAASADLSALIDQVNRGSEPVTITGPHGNAVLIGQDTWRSIQESLSLISVPGMSESLQRARQEGIGSGSTELDW